MTPSSNPVVQLIRTVGAVLVGLMSITLIVEPIEFLLVTAANGGLTTDPYEYFQVRNRGWLLALKMVYNTGAAVAAGYLTAWIAGRAPLAHAAVVAVLQVAAFAFAMATPELRQTGPGWMWFSLLAATPIAIVAGAWLRRR
jgi:hypothetical protein